MLFCVLAKYLVLIYQQNYSYFLFAGDFWTRIFSNQKRTEDSVKQREDCPEFNAELSSIAKTKELLESELLSEITDNSRKKSKAVLSLADEEPRIMPSNGNVAIEPALEYIPLTSSDDPTSNHDVYKSINNYNKPLHKSNKESCVNRNKKNNKSDVYFLDREKIIDHMTSFDNYFSKTNSTCNHYRNNTNGHTQIKDCNPFDIRIVPVNCDNKASTAGLALNKKPTIGEFGGCPWKKPGRKYDIGVVG